MLTGNFLISSSDYCLTLTKGKHLFVKSCMVSVGLFDKLGNAEVDDIVVSLYIRPDRFLITLQQHCPLMRAVSSHTLFPECGDFMLFLLEVLKT